MLELMQGGLARGTLLAPSQSPKGKVPSILSCQHASGLTLLSHAQCNAGPCGTWHMSLERGQLTACCKGLIQPCHSVST